MPSKDPPVEMHDGMMATATKPVKAIKMLFIGFREAVADIASILASCSACTPFRAESNRSRMGAAFGCSGRRPILQSSHFRALLSGFRDPSVLSRLAASYSWTCKKMNCNPERERDADNADPDNHPCVMAFQRTLNVVCNSFLVGQIFG
jgi:hypothetical protein